MGSVQGFFEGLPDAQQDLFRSVAVDLQASAPEDKIERLKNFHGQLKNEIDVINKRRQGLGAVLNNERSITGKVESLTQDVLYSSTTVIYVDTVDFSSGVKGKISIPRNLGVGFMFRYSDQLAIGADYFWQNWSEATFFGENDSLINSNSLHAGLEFVPNRFALRNYLARINYRIGGYISNTYLQLDGEQLRDLGISFGVGLPLNRNRSMINLTFEYGKRGTPSKNLIEERYGMISFGLTLYDNWFMKRKFD